MFKMSLKIMLFTANVSGGIIQFTFQLYHVLKELGHSVVVCLPNEMYDSDIDEVSEEDRMTYHKVKKVFNKHPYHEIARRIEEYHPECLWYCDDSIICSEVGLAIKDKGIKQLLSLHDAGGYHPTYHESIRDKVLHIYTRIVNHSFYDKVYRFVLYSPESNKLFINRQPKYSNKSVIMNLGAHVPKIHETKPEEMKIEEDYLLFIGRIDKYKGIGTLLKAYQLADKNALPLVIAGNGAFSEGEKVLLNETHNMTLINRYISDGEMKWLFRNATAVVLPYIEATQSGVIPIAYYYSKPVIVSEVPGLTQFVEDGDTGYICRSLKEWVDRINKMNPYIAQQMNDKIVQYYNDNLLWENNVKRMLSQL